MHPDSQRRKERKGLVLDWTMNEAAAVEDLAQARLERPVEAVSFGLKLRIGPKSLGQFTRDFFFFIFKKNQNFKNICPF